MGIYQKENMIYLIAVNQYRAFKISEIFVEIGKYLMKFYDQNFTFQAIDPVCFSRKTIGTTFVEYLLSSDPEIWALHMLSLLTTL